MSSHIAPSPVTSFTSAGGSSGPWTGSVGMAGFRLLDGRGDPAGLRPSQGHHRGALGQAARARDLHLRGVAVGCQYLRDGESEPRAFGGLCIPSSGISLTIACCPLPPAPTTPAPQDNLLPGVAILIATRPPQPTARPRSSPPPSGSCPSRPASATLSTARAPGSWRRPRASGTSSLASRRARLGLPLRHGDWEQLVRPLPPPRENGGVRQLPLPRGVREQGARGVHPPPRQDDPAAHAAHQQVLGPGPGDRDGLVRDSGFVADAACCPSRHGGFFFLANPIWRRTFNVMNVRGGNDASIVSGGHGWCRASMSVANQGQRGAPHWGRGPARGTIAKSRPTN